MSLGIDVLQNFCDASRLKPWKDSAELFIIDGVDPYRSEGITEQFLSNAHVYHERYFHPGQFGVLLQNAFERAGFPIGSKPDLNVLDLGSGSGNTVIPLVLGNSSLKVVATDLSIDLLEIMATLVRTKDYADRIGFVCADANRVAFRPEVFDLVVGASIIHHLMDPKEAIINALSYLKPGGIAVFFEPFEYGCNIMKNIYHMILDDPRCPREIPPEAANSFAAMIRDYNARIEVDTVKPFTKYLDDKWLFTRKFFAEMAAQTGCKQVDIFSNRTDFNQYYTGQLLENLRLGGQGHTELPAWALEIPEEFDRSLSESLKSRMIIDGTVVIQK